MDTPSANMRLNPAVQASEFFVEFRVGDATPAVRARFEKWLRASPEHVRAYLEVAAGWSDLPTADPGGRIDLQALLAVARNGGDENVVQLRSRSANAGRQSNPGRVRPWAIAASLALMVGLGSMAFWFYTSGTRTYSTGIGEQRTLILADGSTVILNARTTVTVHMTNDVRNVILIRGQAYFHDTDELDRPFIVRSGTSMVRAIGTEFDVDKESDRTVVTVLEGRVAVANSFGVDRPHDRRRELHGDLAETAIKVQAVLVLRRSAGYRSGGRTYRRRRPSTWKR